MAPVVEPKTAGYLLNKVPEREFPAVVPCSTVSHETIESYGASRTLVGSPAKREVAGSSPAGPFGARSSAGRALTPIDTLLLAPDISALAGRRTRVIYAIGSIPIASLTARVAQSVERDRRKALPSSSPCPRDSFCSSRRRRVICEWLRNPELSGLHLPGALASLARAALSAGGRAGATRFSHKANQFESDGRPQGRLAGSASGTPSCIPCSTSPRLFVLEPERSTGYRPTWLRPGCPGSVIFSLE